MNELTEYKHRIRKQAQQLFLQYGVRSVSMDDIASSMGSSKKTIYQHFSDKDTLVEAVVDSILQENYAECETNKKMASNAIDEAFIAINHTTELFNRMNPLVVYDLKKYHPKAYKKFLDYKNEFLFQILKSNISWGIKDGLFRNDLNVEVISRFRVEGILLTFMPDFQSKTNVGIAELHKELFYFFLYGLSTPKGYALITKYREQKLNVLSNDKN